jgi:Trk-type K+ transport system membrane component
MLPVAAVGERILQTGARFPDTLWQAVSAFASLGWPPIGPAAQQQNALYAAIGLVGALGWPVWLRLVQRTVPWRALALTVVSYAAFLGLSAALITALEAPRQSGKTEAWAASAAGSSGGRLADQPTETRYAHSLTQAVAASSAGLPTERLAQRGVRDATKVVLSGVVLVGGLGGSPGGGIKWPLLLWALAGGAALLGGRAGRALNEQTRRCVLAGVGVTSGVVLLAVVVAFGLLVIEAGLGSRWESPPTFADALLDASSAVGGANVSSGLLRALTSAHLSSGIRQKVDEYQYGMAWLMLAMFLGRVLPVLVVARVARLRFKESGPRLPALL